MGNRQQIELRPSFGGACGCVVMTPWWKGVKAELPLNASNLPILIAPLAHKASKILTWSGLDTRLSAPIWFPTCHALLLYAERPESSPHPPECLPLQGSHLAAANTTQPWPGAKVPGAPQPRGASEAAWACGQGWHLRIHLLPTVSADAIINFKIYLEKESSLLV